MHAATRVTGLAAAGLAALGASVGCSAKNSGSPPHTATVTVVASPSHPATTSSAAPTPTPTPAPKLVKKLPGDCGLLPLYDVQQASGLRLAGKTAFVVGIPEKNIGRLAYINCRYGLASAKATPQLEIGVSLYDTPTQATKRLHGTLEDYQGHGATARPVTVAGHPGTLLTGGSGQDYSVPLLVAASGQRTVAVSLQNGLTSAANLPTVMTKIAALALERTGG